MWYGCAADREFLAIDPSHRAGIADDENTSAPMNPPGLLKRVSLTGGGTPPQELPA
jgi:hypothetical protein